MAENKLDYVEYDKNMVVESSVGDKPVKLFDVRSEPFEVYGFYDYKNKYQAGSAIETCPAHISEELTRKMQGYAEAAYKALGISA